MIFFEKFLTLGKVKLTYFFIPSIARRSSHELFLGFHGRFILVPGETPFPPPPPIRLLSPSVRPESPNPCKNIPRSHFRSANGPGAPIRLPPGLLTPLSTFRFDFLENVKLTQIGKNCLSPGYAGKVL